MSNESCLDMNTELWLYRQDVSTLSSTMAIFAVLYALIIVFGVVGNSCVILAILKNKSLQTVPNLFILSLSCSDVVVCCIAATITPITAFKKEWLFGTALCSIAPWIAGISLCFSTFTLTAISVDRYMLIRHPMKKPLTKPRALCVIAMIATFAAALSAPPMFKQRLAEFESFCGLYCTEEWGQDQHGRKVYGAVMLIVQFLIPLTVIIISYTAISLRIGQSIILKGTQKNTTPDCDWQASLTDQQRIALRRRQRTNRMLIAMVVAFSASWFWSVTFNTLRDYDYLPDYVKSQEYIFGIGTHCIAMTSTVWNPLLYAMLNLQLRAAFIRLMPAKLRRRFAGEADLEKTSPLINGNATPNVNEHTMVTARSAAKYGATQRETLGLPDCGDGCTTTLNKTASRHSISSRRGSRPLTAIRVIVSKISSGVSDFDSESACLVRAIDGVDSDSEDDEDMEVILGAGSSSWRDSPAGLPPPPPPRRRRSAASAIVRPLSSMAAPVVEPSMLPLLILRTNSF